MSFIFEDLGEVLVVIYSDEVAAHDSGELRRLISSKAAARRVVMDMTGVALITTPGLGTLLAMHKYCIESSRQLILVGLSPYVKEIFNLTRLTRVFEIRETRQDALN